MAKQPKETKNVTSNVVFQMRAPPDFFVQLDEWRRAQPDLPGRAEAIRRLVALGLTVKPKAGSKK
jgi:hypothetical protein